MTTENDINDLMDKAIIDLADDDINIGAESLVEIAKIFAKGGMPQSSFMNIRQYVINEAVKQTDVYFIQEKLKIAEVKLRDQRNGSSIIH